MNVEINADQTNGSLVEAFLEQQKKLPCFVGICLFSSMANRRFLEEFLPWVIQRTDRLFVILGDYLERHNLMVLDGLSEDKACRKVLRKGRRVKRTIDAILSKSAAEAEVEHGDWKTCLEDNTTQEILMSLQDYANRNEEFRNDLLHEVRGMLERSQRVPAERYPLSESDIKKLSAYVLEELAFFLSLYQLGYHVEIYPGEDIGIMQRIDKGEYINFPWACSQRTHISVIVKQETSHSENIMNNNESED